MKMILIFAALALAPPASAQNAPLMPMPSLTPIPDPGPPPVTSFTPPPQSQPVTPNMLQQQQTVIRHNFQQ